MPHRSALALLGRDCGLFLHKPSDLSGPYSSAPKNVDLGFRGRLHRKIVAFSTLVSVSFSCASLLVLKVRSSLRR